MSDSETQVFTTHYELPVKAGTSVKVNTFGRNLRVFSAPNNFAMLLNGVGTRFPVRSTFELLDAPSDIRLVQVFNDSIVDGTIIFDVSAAKVSDNIQLASISGTVATVPLEGFAFTYNFLAAANNHLEVIGGNGYANAVVINNGAYPIYIGLRYGLTVANASAGNAIEVLPRERIVVPCARGFNIVALVKGAKACIIFTKGGDV